MMLKSAALNMSANLENLAVAIGLEKVGFHSNPKEGQCQILHLYLYLYLSFYLIQPYKRRKSCHGNNMTEPGGHYTK